MREDLIRRRERILDEDQEAQLKEAEFSPENEPVKKKPVLTVAASNDAPKRFGATIGELCKDLQIE